LLLLGWRGAGGGVQVFEVSYTNFSKASVCGSVEGSMEARAIVIKEGLVQCGFNCSVIFERQIELSRRRNDVSPPVGHCKSRDREFSEN
jgi:hypothetical protein